MSQQLSTASDLDMRKELVRLRMEMHRQQLLYHAQPLSHPFEQARSMLAERRESADSGTGKKPLMMAATIVLALFGRRLGRIGTLARVAITLYPLLKGQQKLRRALR
ncbi:hypothetical protein YO5_08688 [Stutzerimonas stutzeri TS44]|nr:hypothetical protein YO5_08688 [Stutzerimonas stutzeri TS44]